MCVLEVCRTYIGFYLSRANKCGLLNIKQAAYCKQPVYLGYGYSRIISFPIPIFLSMQQALQYHPK